MFEITFGKGYVELPANRRTWMSVVRGAVDIAEREGDWIVSIKHRPDREYEHEIDYR